MNKNLKLHYIYFHYTLDGILFYVGSGFNNDNYSRGCTVHTTQNNWAEYLMNYLNKDQLSNKDFNTVIFSQYTELTIDEVNELEYNFIKILGRIGKEEHGILVNIQVGGCKSEHGTILTPEEKEIKKKEWGDKWLKNNQEKRKESLEKYVENNRGIINKRNIKWRKENKQSYINWRERNKEKIKIDNKIYRENNKDKIRELKKDWKRRNPEKVKERRKRYYEKNKEYWNTEERKERRRERIKNETPEEKEKRLKTRREWYHKNKIKK